MNEKILSLLPAFALLCAGLGFAWIGSGYDIGTLTAMGPGFLPVALGSCLALIAAVLLWLEKPSAFALQLPLRPVLCVSIGLLAWVLLAERVGFVGAGLVQVVFSALALPGQKWRTVAILAVVLIGAAYVLFVALLGMPLPAFGS
jgi:hypothetical protein